ncbi:unnamed protein product [Gongylonema pulchrum]|uniref:glucuronosyltransferase n=1 Tax=Gongylonema pulchrum TaxID=637853 RepID=A0A183CWH5_9BILA|nr:unnamed protein product [Gongylonema pulchrum]
MLLWPLLTTVFLFISGLPVGAYKILIFSPRFGRSHVKFMGAVADILAEAGHNVTVFLPIMSPLVTTNGTKGPVRTITVPTHPEVMRWCSDTSFIHNGWSQKTASLSGLLAVSFQNFEIHRFLNKRRDLQLTSGMSDMFTLACESVLEHTNVLEELKAEKFDLAMMEIFDGCPIGFAKFFCASSFLFCPEISEKNRDF